MARIKSFQPKTILLLFSLTFSIAVRLLTDAGALSDT